VTLDVVLATRNLHKVAEVRRILAASAAGAGIRLIGLNDVAPGMADVAETGTSFAENSLLKARAACAETGMVAVADDSGIAVDALNGMPGIFSARWAGAHGQDGTNLRLLLDQLADVPDERRGAQFVCVASAVFPAGREVVARGEVGGTLLRRTAGSGGFGYDPIFVPTGFTRTTAQMTGTEKDALSHRGAAFRQLAHSLRMVP